MVGNLIERTIEGMSGEFSIVLKELATGRILFSLCEDRVVPSASTIKILILYEAIKQILSGGASFDERIRVLPEDRVGFSLVTEMGGQEYSLRELLVLMISVSDNTATNLIMDRLGMDSINAAAESLGLSDTKLQRKMMDFEAAERGRQNYTSPRDMMKLLEMVYRREVLTPEACGEIIDIMSIAAERDFMLRYLPAEAKVAHKPGELDGINHDIGIVHTDSGDYLLGIFITKLRNNIEGREYIARLSVEVFNHMTKPWEGSR